ncbi:MAG: hypothetical protein K9G58_08720 [Bacteroidales bacterium]|nr:hypothetical protein [Bacteroidales bacterium]MCF8386789.1 hypothetical protein [Bacteroidales bacterium]MCF8398236.1 hypothetical protein [Bacteroidales bacterium]
MNNNINHESEYNHQLTADQLKDAKYSFLSRGCANLPKDSNRLNGIYQSCCCKYDVFDWLKNIEAADTGEKFDCVEVRFKNSRKEFFRYTTDYELNTGDIVAVESNPGHDIGIVSLTGELVKLQMKRKKIDPQSESLKKVYRKARVSDIQKWVQSVKKEETTKLKTRKIANDLSLDMKINDVEYQGDDTKAIFYYTADERVDFRELIKVLADQFKVRIEMKQIGARQEASRIGGIGSCGRELCCATWMCDFSSVTTSTARTQQLSLNPQKLAGQCGKLKCCLNYENKIYEDALKEFPDPEVKLKTKKGNAVYQKADVFKKLLWYSYDNEKDCDIMAIPLDKVKKIISMNMRKKLPEKLEDFAATKEQKTHFENAVDTEDLKRFDKLQ